MGFICLWIMKKFNSQDVAELTEITRQEMNRCHHLRFGQALWNAAHDRDPEIMDELRGTKKDFFYVTNPGNAWAMFLENYTEQGESSVETNQSDLCRPHGDRPVSSQCSPCNNGYIS